jgi:hypothetical protein
MHENVLQTSLASITIKTQKFLGIYLNKPCKVMASYGNGSGTELAKCPVWGS